MTDYITIHGVQKRSLSIPVHLSDERVIITSFDTYIARNGDTYIARNGDTYISHDTTETAYAKVIPVRKRSFSIPVKVKE